MKKAAGSVFNSNNHTNAFPWDSYHTLVCSRGALCILLISSHRMLTRHVAKGWGLTKSIIPSTSWRIFFNAWMKLTWQRRIQWLRIQFDVKALIHAHTLEVSHHRQKKHTSFDFRKSLNKSQGPPEDWTSNFENLRIGVIVLQNWKRP